MLRSEEVRKLAPEMDPLRMVTGFIVAFIISFFA